MHKNSSSPPAIPLFWIMSQALALTITLTSCKDYKAPSYTNCDKRGGNSFEYMFIRRKKIVTKITLLSTSDVTLPSALLWPPCSVCRFLGLRPTIAFSNLDLVVFDAASLVFCAAPRFCALFCPFGRQTCLALPSKSWPMSFSTLSLSYLKNEINQKHFLFDQHWEALFRNQN